MIKFIYNTPLPAIPTGGNPVGRPDSPFPENSGGLIGNHFLCFNTSILTFNNFITF